MKKDCVDREKQDKEFFDVGVMGLVGAGMGYFALSISLLSLVDIIIGAVLFAIGLILINSWKEPYEYRVNYLKWITVFLGLSYVAYPSIFIINYQPVNLKLLFLIISLIFSSIALFGVLKVKKRLIIIKSGGKDELI